MNDLVLGVDDEGGGGGQSFLAYLPAIFWQRRWWVVVPFVVGIVASIAAALLIPPRYEATAVMLVQASQLPDEVIGELNDSQIERRIAAIRQRVTSRPDLLELINRHGLYSDRRSSDPLSEIIEDMREDITLTPSTVELPSSGADQRTIAFELAFGYREASPAQAVVQDLMDRILELDASGNLEQATNTAQFLEDQAKGLDQQIAEVEGQIAAINSQYGGILGSTGAVFGGGGGSYDVQIAALQRDNANLVRQKDLAQRSDERDPVVVGAETALAAARAVYAENHPDVIFARQRLAEARELARTNTDKLPLDTIDQQIEFNNTQIAQLRAAKAQELAQVSSQLASQARAPMIQQQITALQQRLSGLNQQYQRVQERLLSARAGVRAEDQQMGQRLAVVEPPVIPEEPVWPDRLLIIAAGIGGGLAFGFLLAAAVELFNRPIRDPKALEAISGVPSLGVVPTITRISLGTRRPRWLFWRKAALQDGA
jgi:succinoglycan biosynthesis transport protein ExoP